MKIEQLTKEYKAYVRKLRELEPGLTAVPWTDRAYTRKRKLQDDSGDGELGMDEFQLFWLHLEPFSQFHQKNVHGIGLKQFQLL